MSSHGILVSFLMVGECSNAFKIVPSEVIDFFFFKKKEEKKKNWDAEWPLLLFHSQSISLRLIISTKILGSSWILWIKYLNCIHNWEIVYINGKERHLYSLPKNLPQCTNQWKYLPLGLPSRKLKPFEGIKTNVTTS